MCWDNKELHFCRVLCQKSCSVLFDTYNHTVIQVSHKFSAMLNTVKLCCCEIPVSSLSFFEYYPIKTLMHLTCFKPGMRSHINYTTSTSDSDSWFRLPNLFDSDSRLRLRPLNLFDSHSGSKAGKVLLGLSTLAPVSENFYSDSDFEREKITTPSDSDSG